MYLPPEDPDQRKLWDRIERILDRVKALKEPDDIYLPPALQPRQAKILRWIDAINDRLCDAGIVGPPQWVTISDWIQVPLYTTLDLSLVFDRELTPEEVAEVEAWRKKRRPKGRRYREGGWVRTPAGKFVRK